MEDGSRAELRASVAPNSTASACRLCAAVAMVYRCQFRRVDVRYRGFHCPVIAGLIQPVAINLARIRLLAYLPRRTLYTQIQRFCEGRVL